MRPGARLGPYEIVAPLGAGGMGEVWKARDTRLDRNVAIKVLPAEFAANSQLKLRFEREAKTISQLNHPNICTLHDVGDGYLVMELLEGESLADRLTRGALPVADTLRVGVQIANALDRAHRAGIVAKSTSRPSSSRVTTGRRKAPRHPSPRFPAKPLRATTLCLKPASLRRTFILHVRSAPPATLSSSAVTLGLLRILYAAHRLGSFIRRAGVHLFCTRDSYDRRAHAQ